MAGGGPNTALCTLCLPGPPLIFLFHTPYHTKCARRVRICQKKARTSGLQRYLEQTSFIKDSTKMLTGGVVLFRSVCVYDENVLLNSSIVCCTPICFFPSTFRQSHVTNAVRICAPSGFKFGALKHAVPPRECLSRYSFGLGISSCYLTYQQIIRNKSSALTSSGNFQAWCSAQTRHTNKGGVSRVIQRRWLWIFGKVAALTTLSTTLEHQISSSTCHWMPQELTCPWTKTGSF